MTTKPPPVMITEFGCCFCQRRHLPCWHREGIDPEYTAHQPYQSKHGTRRRPARPAELVALELAREIGPLVPLE